MKNYINIIGSAIACCLIMPLHLFVVNYPQIAIQNMLLVVAIFLAIFACIFSVLQIFFRNVSKSSLLMYVIGGSFWLSYPIAKFFVDYFDLINFVYRIKYRWFFLFLGCFFFVFVFVFILKHCPKFIEKLSNILALFVLVLTGLLITYGCKNFLMYSEKENKNLIENYEIAEEKQYPNIYHILLDAHPNQKSMEIMGGDLKPFYQKLENLGFVTFPDSRSNYFKTIWSVPSMLNMDYLEEGWEQKRYSYLFNLAQSGKVFKHLTAKGYSINISIHTDIIAPFYPVIYIKNNSIQSGVFSYFNTLLSKTPISHFFKFYFSKFFKQAWIRSINKSFEYLENCKNIYGTYNNLFYVHFLCPHVPIVFDDESNPYLNFAGFCELDNSAVLTEVSTHKSYCRNVYGIDNLALEAIRKIISQYKTESVQPIIILHSDHSMLGAPWIKSPCITLDTVYGNLLALYVHDEWKQEVKDLKFINLYRWIFNHLFQEKYKYLEDKIEGYDFDWSSIGVAH